MKERMLKCVNVAMRIHFSLPEDVEQEMEDRIDEWLCRLDEIVDEFDVFHQEVINVKPQCSLLAASYLLLQRPRLPGK